MNSTTSREREEQRKEEEIRRQIALLQAQLPSTKSAPRPPPESPKRKRAPGVLAPATPSPKKRKVAHKPNVPRVSAPGALPVPSSSSRTALSSKSHTSQCTKPAASSLVTKLASLTNSSASAPDAATSRSSSFAAIAPALPAHDSGHIKRDDTLAIIEDLEIGPIEHKPPGDDPAFERLEPYSGIYLKSRTVPHADIQDYMTGRYFLSPSLLYSVVRLQPNKQAYDVPVEGDYVVIAVVAERGPIRMSRAPVAMHREREDDAGSEDEFFGGGPSGKGKEKDTKGKGAKGKGKGKEGPAPQSGRKYVTLKLIDFGSRSSSSAIGGKAMIRGDAFLNLLLFESEDVKDVVDPETGKKERVYRGGSKGAFEQMASLREGSVVALLNPRVLRPFQKTSDAPHPVTNILGITPESAESALVIGYARDLGICTVLKKDGKPCGSWTDKRRSEVCEWHVQNAVQRRRAGRAEFSAGTSSLASAATMQRKKTSSAYNPSQKWGLRPEDGAVERQLENDGGGATYVVQGHVLSRNARPVAETMGREEQARAKRKRDQRETEKLLERLKDRDGDGMGLVMRAREKGRENKGEKGDREQRGKKEKDEEEIPKERKNVFSASVIKNLGFDPTAGTRRGPAEEEVRRKLEGISAIHASRTNIQLGPRPGKKATTVRTPPRAKHSSGSSSEGVRDLSDSDSDLEVEPPEIKTAGASSAPRGSGSEGMVDLDGSSDLETEG